jgi:hypothetical protein
MLNSTPKLLLGVRAWTRDPVRLSPFPLPMAPLLTLKDMRRRKQGVARRSILSCFCTAFLAAISLQAVAGVVGCSPQKPISTPGPEAASRSVDAEWDNVSTAVEVGASQAQCAVVRSEAMPDGLERRFVLKHVSGRHGLVSARRVATADASKPADIRFECSFGPIPDPVLERRVLARISHRLSDLRGKAFAPISE